MLQSPSGKQRQRGAVAVWVVLSLAVILGVVAICLDGGRVMESRRNVQAAADAAVLAAGADLYSHYWQNHGKDPSGTAQAAGQSMAAAYGLPNGAITINVPPQSGAYSGQNGYVEAIVNTGLDASFGRIFTSNQMPVAARSVACGQPMKIGLILLRPSGADALINNSVALSVINTPVIVNSSDSAAFVQQSFGVILATHFDVAGNYTNPGGALILGTIRTGTQPVLDPLVFLPVPNSSGATIQSTSPLTINTPIPVILQPGIYQGGIQITGLSTVVMLPGVYIMQGGGFQVSGAATVTGLEVMIYNDVGSTYASGPVSISALGKVVLVPPLSGVYQSIGIFQNRSLATPITVAGAGLVAITGVVYAASAPANLTGSAAVGLDILGGAYVVNSMTVSGIGAIHIDLGLNPPRVPDVHLVE